MVNYGVYHFLVTLVRDSGQIRALRASARHQFFVRTIFLFTGEVIYCLIVKTLIQATIFVRLSVYYYPISFFQNSHVVLSHIQRSQSQRWITATFITQLLSNNCAIQESWGEFSDEADSLRGPRTAIKVPGVWRTSCYT